MYTINQSLCTFCAGCSSVCPVMAIEMHDDSSRIRETCISCGACGKFCPVSAVEQTSTRNPQP